MRKVLVVGIGPGHPEQITMQAVNALNRVDVFFVLDKGREKDDLVRLRKDICRRYVRNDSFRIVAVSDPPRDRTPEDYGPVVEAWHEERAALLERGLTEELTEDQCGAFLVWGDPSLYDSTLRVLERLLARGKVAFEYEVIPGVTSVQALAAAHRIVLNGIGEPVHVTTGRRLAQGFPPCADSVVVMLDGGGAFANIDDSAIDIYWGAYLGTEAEILVAGRLQDVAGSIEEIRRDARRRNGWIMDTYLLRRRRS
jgi:precorrin-6A synthase